MLAALVLAAASPVTVVATTSMLGAAVRDVTPPEAVRTVTLLPPGSCPGHFDLPGRTLARLRDAGVVLRHPFEEALDERLGAAGVASETVAVIAVQGPLTVPEHYERLLVATAAELSRRVPDAAPDIAARTAAARARAAAAGARARAVVEPLAGTPVIASVMQADLCRSLGLRVVAELPRAETATPHDLEPLLGAEPRFVVANLQEGITAAAALAERLDVPLAVLSNFPDAPGYGHGFAGLIEANSERLREAWTAASSR